MSRIGILGGSFNPPHLGHLAIAKAAKEALKLDRVLFIPAYISPHKTNFKPLSANHRINMLKLLLEGHMEFQISTMELRRKGISFTIDTLKQVKRKYPTSEIFLLIGEDNLAVFSKWKSSNMILALATLTVYRRWGFRNKTRILKTEYQSLPGKMIRSSSTGIRENIAHDRPIQHEVGERIAWYIQHHNLYQTKQTLKRIRSL